MSEIILKTILVRHSDSVNSVAFHPTELILATGCRDKTVKLWRFSPDGSTAICVATLEGHSSSVNSVAFHPTEPILASGSDDNTVKLWRFSPDGSTATCVATLEGHSRNWVYSVAFHPTDSLLATGYRNKTVKLWRFSPNGSVANNMSAVCVATLEGYSSYVLSVAFHPTEPILATNSDKTVKLWRFSPNGSEANNMSAVCVATLTGHSSSVYSVAFHPTEPILASGSDDNTVKLWRFSPDGWAENNISAVCVATLAHSTNAIVRSVAFHPTEPILASGIASGIVDNTVKLWRFSPNGSAANNMLATCVATLPGGTQHAYINSVAFHPTEPFLATGSSYDDIAKIYKLNIENLLISSANNSGLTIHYNQDGTKEIRIEKELLKPTGNSSNTSCPSFMPLYNKIMKTNLDGEFRFKFEEQAGYDVGGLTRSIFDKVLPVYTHKFFDTIEINNEFLILKKDIPTKIFEHETNQLLLLAEKARAKIFLRIDPRLLDLLLSPDLKKYFSNNKKNFEKFYKNVNNAIKNNSYDILNKISNSIFLRINKNQNNKNTVINRYKKKIDPLNNSWEAPPTVSMNSFLKLGQINEQSQEIKNSLQREKQYQKTKNMLLREIRLRRFLAECGFSSWEQVQNMYLFIKKFWDPKKFSSELKFDIESFSKKIKIFKENSYDNYTEYSLDKFVKLSKNNSMQFDFNNLNNSIFPIYDEYNFFRPFLNYILGPESTDEIRKLFVHYVSGTIYYPGELNLVLSHQLASYPFKSETCFNRLKFFKSNPQNPQPKINNKNNFIKNEIKPNKSSVNFGLV